MLGWEPSGPRTVWTSSLNAGALTLWAEERPQEHRLWAVLWPPSPCQICPEVLASVEPIPRDSLSIPWGDGFYSFLLCESTMFTGNSTERLSQAKFISTCYSTPMTKNRALTAKNVHSPEVREGAEMKLSSPPVKAKTVNLTALSPQARHSPTLFHANFTPSHPLITPFLNCGNTTHHNSKHFHSYFGL